MVRHDRLTLSVAETAERLGVGIGTCREAIRTGHIPSIRCGRRILVPLRALDRLLEQTPVESTEEGETDSGTAE